jgi:hypothetical protein
VAPSLAAAGALLREWRNRQTRRIQVPVPARAWGFNSPLAHPVSTGDGRM